MNNMETINYKEFKEMQTDVKDIKNALLGTDYNGKEGIVTMVQDHEERLTTIEKGKERQKWILVGLSMGSGVGLYETVKNILTLFNKH